MRNILITLILFLTVAPTALAAVTHVSGEAVVRSIAPNRVAVFIDTTGDHVIDKGFLLSADIPTGSGLAVHFPAAEIEYNDGYVRVASGGRFYDLVVAGYPEPPATPEDSRVVTMIGYALVQSSGDSGCNIERAYQHDAETCYSYGTK